MCKWRNALILKETLVFSFRGIVYMTAQRQRCRVRVTIVLWIPLLFLMKK